MHNFLASPWGIQERIPKTFIIVKRPLKSEKNPHSLKVGSHRPSTIKTSGNTSYYVIIMSSCRAIHKCKQINLLSCHANILLSLCLECKLYLTEHTASLTLQVHKLQSTLHCCFTESKRRETIKHTKTPDSCCTNKREMGESRFQGKLF